MATRHVTRPDGRVLMRNPANDTTAWFSPRTVPHHQRAGWVLATPNDQPGPAGDTGTPDGGSDNQKGTKA